MDTWMVVLLAAVLLAVGVLIGQQGRKSRVPATGAGTVPIVGPVPDTAADRTRLVEGIRAQRTGIVLTGRVVNGRVELDEETLAAIAQEFPSAEVSFVAVNAPFDPRSP